MRGGRRTGHPKFFWEPNGFFFLIKKKCNPKIFGSKTPHSAREKIKAQNNRHVRVGAAATLRARGVVFKYQSIVVQPYRCVWRVRNLVSGLRSSFLFCKKKTVLCFPLFWGKMKYVPRDRPPRAVRYGRTRALDAYTAGGGAH
jgi:hypothetical protein